MKASPKPTKRNVPISVAGFGLFAIGALSVSTRGQDALRDSTDSRDAATRVSAQATAAAPFITCLADGLGDVGSCIDGFPDGSSPDASGDCFERASARFSQCLGAADAASSDDSTNGVKELGLGLMARAAEHTLAQMREEDPHGDPDVAAPIVTRAEKTQRKRAGLRDDVPTIAAQAEVEVLFLSCLSGGTADVRSCADVSTDASDPDGVWICFEAASNQFLRCMGSTSAAGSGVPATGVERLGLGLLASVAERVFKQVPSEESAPRDLRNLGPEPSPTQSLAEAEGLLRPRDSIDSNGDAVNAGWEDVDPQVSFAVRRPDPRDSGNSTRTNTGYRSPTGSSWGTCGIALCDCPGSAGFPSAVSSSVNLTPLKTWYFPLLNAIYLKLDRCCHLDEPGCQIPDSRFPACIWVINHECAHACAAARYGYALYTVLTSLEWIRCNFVWDCSFYEQEALQIDLQSDPFTWNVKVFSQCADGSP